MNYQQVQKLLKEKQTFLSKLVRKKFQSNKYLFHLMDFGLFFDLKKKKCIYLECFHLNVGTTLLNCCKIMKKTNKILQIYHYTQ